MDIQDILTSVGAIVVVLAVVFRALDSLSSDTTKNEVRGWLVSFWMPYSASRNLGYPNWKDVFISSFDSFFGKEIFSWRRIKGSWAISTGSVVAATLAWWALQPDEFHLLLDKTKLDITGLFTGILVTAYILNLIPDYLSTLQTRWLMGISVRIGSSPITAILVLLDILLTGVIFYLFFIVFLVLFNEIYGLSEEIRNVWDAMSYTDPIDASSLLLSSGITLTAHSPGNPSIGIFLYSTYFSTFWFLGLVIIALSLSVIRYLLEFIGFGTLELMYKMERTEKPFTVLGYITSFIAAGVIVVSWTVF